MFSEKLAQIDSQCISDMQMGNQNSPFCINEEFRTVNGGGDFDPFDTSEGEILLESHHGLILKDFWESNRGLFHNWSIVRHNCNLYNWILDGCFKQSMHEHHAKDACCGIYPNRLPFDTLSRECCRKSAQDGDNTFSVDTLGLFSNSFLIQFIKSYIISIFHRWFCICSSPCRLKIADNHVIIANRL